MNLYYLGPKGTYSELASKKALSFLKEDFELTPVSTIQKTLELAQKNNCFALVPIENSIEGIVRPTIDSLYLSPLKIKAQLEIKIKHCLVSKSNKIEKNKIKHIISHPQALAQCSNFILQNFDENIDLINSTSTANAINSLLNLDESYCAIGSNALAKELNLNILEENIGDIKDNKTRFVLVSSRDLNIKKETRTSIVFNTKNKSGALFEILKIFKKYDLNLVYIESRPSKKTFGEYNFFVDIDKGKDEIKDALFEIEKNCDYYKLLGSYFELDFS